MNLARTKSHRIERTSRGAQAPARPLSGDLGQALIELALVLPVLLLLLVGAAEIGRLAYYAIEVSNAARAGVAYGSQDIVKATDDPGMQASAVDDAPNVSGLIVTPTHFCTCSTGGAIDCTTAGAACPSPARIIHYVQVNTTATVAPMFNYPGVSKTFTLYGQAIMRVDQ